MALDKSDIIWFASLQLTPQLIGLTGFVLRACHLYFRILVEIFTNHILGGNELHRVNKTQYHGLKTCKQVPNYSVLSLFQKHSY